MINPILARFQDAQAMVPPEQYAWLEAFSTAASVELANLNLRIEATGDRMDNGDFWFAPDDWRSAYRPYVVKDGILHVPVRGMLLHAFTYALGDWATGYDYIWQAMLRGVADPEVRGIALVVDSGGGMVSGCFALADKIYALRGAKPIRGFAAEHAYSAAYALICATDHITVARTGGVGSIGVVTSHMDASGMMTQYGLKRTWIHKGAHKVDGNSDGPLPDDVKARWLADLEVPYSLFVSTVARNRGLDEQVVRDTEALTFRAPDALSNGLVDAIGDFGDALADFTASLNPNVGDETMADFTQADLDNAVATATANHATAVAAARAEGAAEGATAERARINEILGSDAGKERPKAALSAALKTNMDLETATAFLGDLPAEAATETVVEPAAGVGKKVFDAAMGKTQNPDLADNGGEGGEGDAEDAMLAQSFADRPAKK